MFGNNKYPHRRFHPMKIVFFILVFTAFVSAASWVVMFLWNNILVDATGVKPLNFWKAVGLLVLAKILFGGFRRPGSWGGSKRAHWRKKWRSMSEEERQQFKSKWKERCRRRGEGEHEKEE